MLSCKEATRLMSLSQDKELSFWEKVQLKIHTSICKYCKSCRVNMNLIRKISQEHSKRDPSDH